MAQRRAHVVIGGVVQGVGFRWSTRRQACALGLTGWVRNLANGSVEAVFEGEDADVRAMVDWCRDGPSSAVVRHVDVEWLEATGESDRFDLAF